MASIKEFNNKLKSLKNTQKITRTMKMVSASKLRRAQDAQTNAKLYAKSITELVSRIALAADATAHPLFKSSDNPKKALILIFTSDKGLCGAFNHNANKKVNQWIEDNKSNFDQIDVSCCGKRGYAFFKKLKRVREHYESITIKPDFKEAKKIGEDLMDHFISEEYDEVYMSYNQFFSPLSQTTIFQKVLPIEPNELLEEIPESDSREYIYEPETTKLLDFLVPHYLYFKVYFALLENSAGEHGARMTAMDNATNNASDMIDSYTLRRNRARQAAITTELTEIVSGAEAL
ncbi:MAG: F-type H+-transporting ATPase subunit gamma [Lysobacterales bacterium]|jgi:F-type H+-transporting ATPase subunit gamma